jgi:hypothetical protein
VISMKKAFVELKGKTDRGQQDEQCAAVDPAL